MTAKEARELSTRAANEKQSNKHSLDKLLIRIKSAAEKGDTHLPIIVYPDWWLEMQISSLGYDIGMRPKPYGLCILW